MDRNTGETKGAARAKLARRQGGAAVEGLDREEAVDTLRTRKRGDGGTLRGRGAAQSRNAGGRVGGEQVARGGHTTGDRTGIAATLSRRGKRGARKPPNAANQTRIGRGRTTGKPGARTRSKAHKAGKKK